MKGGNAEAGKVVFRRNCIACHQVFGEGAAYGPQMEKVATRLNRFKLVESIIDPNAEIDPKYQSTRIETSDGKTITGLLVSENKDAVTIFDGKEKRTIKPADIESRMTIKQSSMPEGLAGTMSPVEFLDVIAFLASLK
jgi:putative heme-binding domain-containing protein